MSGLSLTKTRFSQGVWEGRLHDDSPGAGEPTIQVSIGAEPIGEAELHQQQDAGVWDVRFAIPAQYLDEGTRTFVFSDGANDTTLETFTILAGEALADDIRTELSFVKAELEMLKRAFRRHCSEGA